MPHQESGTPIASSCAQPSSEVGSEPIRAQLKHILASASFVRSERLSRFLTFVTEQTLQGQQNELKEYQVGVEVCGRPNSYDPRTDPVVRVEARRLRAALDHYYANDGAHDELIIALPKGGYVPSFSLKQHPRPESLPEQGVPQARFAQKHSRVIMMATMITTFAAVILAIAGLAYERYWKAKSPLTDKDTVVLADFVNTTGDPVFDGALRHGLSAQLEQSPFLNLLSMSQVAQTLRLMGDSKDTRLTEEKARQVCERTGSTAIIAGSISKLGTQYVLSVKALTCVSEDVLAEEQVTADQKEQVLPALGTVATKLREHLGESLASVQKYDAPPENVTTPSLEALQAYSLGFKVHVVNLDEAGAVAFFRRAVSLDPHFAMAYARMAMCYANLGELGKSAESTRKAYELRDRVSEHEKLFILSLYHQFVTGDLEEARKVYELRAQMYAHDDIPIGNLANVYFNLGRFDRALATTKEALKRNPGSRIWYGNLVSSFIANGQLQQAKKKADEAKTRQLDSPWLHLCLYQIAFEEQDNAALERESSYLKDQPGFDDLLYYYESQAAAHAGRLVESRDLMKRAISIAQHSQQPDSAALYMAQSAVFDALAGNFDTAKREANASLALSKTKNAEGNAILALAIAGDSAQALRLARDLADRFPEDTLVQTKYLPLIQSVVILHGAVAEHANAIEKIAATTPYELGTPTIERVAFLTCYPAYFRGEAYLSTKQGNLAAAEFRKVIEHPYLTLTDPIGTWAYLGLARAYVQSGDKNAAQAAYANFFALLKNADPDLPALKQATLERDRL